MYVVKHELKCRVFQFKSKRFNMEQLRHKSRRKLTISKCSVLYRAQHFLKSIQNCFVFSSSLSNYV